MKFNKSHQQEEYFQEVQLQKLFFQEVQQKAQSEKSMVTELKSILGLGKTAVYRRLSGESMLSLGETLKLARHYNISIDQLIQSDLSRVTFDFPVLQQPVKSAAEFLESIEKAMEQAVNLDQVSVDFVSREIPLFHYFNFPELTAFKAYIWSRTIWQLPTFQERQFSLTQINGIKRHQKNIQKHYISMPGTEIWSTDSLAITLLQIEHYLSNDMFKYPEEALLLCQQLRELFEHLYKMSTHGKKCAPGKEPLDNAPDFSFYHNQLAHSNSFILVNSSVVDMSFVTIDNLHVINSSDPKFCQFMKNWKDRLIEQSIRIDASTTTSRNKFFNNIERQIIAFEKKIKRTVL